MSILLIAFNQEKQIADVVRSALAQTYAPLEIIISDDASSDATFAAIEAAIAGYSGPYKVIARRNVANCGISAHLALIAQMAQGEPCCLVAAGDDMSAQNRVRRRSTSTVAHDRCPI